MSPAIMPKPTTSNVKIKKSCSPLSIMKPRLTKQSPALEKTQPVLVTRRRLTRMDVLPVDSHSLVMALKSGLLMETSWALDALNILLRDDSSMTFCQLDAMPGLLDSLVDHWRDSDECLVSEDVGEKIVNTFITRKSADLLEEKDERVVLMHKSVERVTLVQDSNDVTKWKDGEESVVGYIVRYGGTNPSVGGMDCESLNMVGKVEKMVLSKLSVVTNILRNLSSVAGNGKVMSSHTSFLSQCGKVLASTDIINIQELEDVMVCLANIGLHTDLSTQPSKVVWDILTSLIHWVVSDATQYTFTSTLTPHKMSLEIICKLCLHQANIDLLLATPRVRMVKLCQALSKKLYKSEEQAFREISISIMFYISTSSPALSHTLSLDTPTITLLLSFIEQVEEAAQHVAIHQGVAALRSNPSIMGTSLATIRRAASLLVILAKQPSSSKIFMSQEQRLVNLAMSQIVDQDVARSICEVMFLASKEYEAGRRLVKWGW